MCVPTAVDLHGARWSGSSRDGGGLLVEQTSSPSLSLLRGQHQSSLLYRTPNGRRPTLPLWGVKLSGREICFEHVFLKRDLKYSSTSCSLLLAFFSLSLCQCHVHVCLSLSNADGDKQFVLGPDGDLGQWSWSLQCPPHSPPTDSLPLRLLRCTCVEDTRIQWFNCVCVCRLTQGCGVL